MFTEINLKINEAVPTSTGGTLTGAKLKFSASSQALAGSAYTVGGVAHETQAAEDDVNCESVKIIGLNPKNQQGNPAQGQGQKVLYYEYFGIQITVASFADLDTEAKRVDLIKAKLVELLSVTLANIETV
jgi:hypothetical protein